MNKRTNYRYILRYYIDPDFNGQERLEELVDFCRQAAVDEVMFFDFPEEMYPGYPSEEQIETWLSFAEKVKASLAEIGVDLSINPWSSITQLSRGRKFEAWQSDWRPMVGDTCVASKIVSCPLCEKWQAYVGAYFQRIAERLNPVAIWIEDDWRLHNHGEELGYGGCYCPEHLRRFSEMVGETVDRETLLKNLFDTKAVHPWRAKWLELCRETLLEAGENLRKHCSVPLALMSSTPSDHATEGRDWNRVKKSLTGDKPLMLRPHLQPYNEVRPFEIPPSVTRWTMSNINDVIVYPEMESSPRSGCYSKSNAFVRWACLHSICYGVDGITFNHFDMMGNGISLDPGFSKTLNEMKPLLNKISALNLSDSQSEGIDVLYSPRAAEFAQSSDPNSMTGLLVHAQLWSSTFYALGISHQFTQTIGENRIIAVSGETVRAFSNDEILRLMSNMVFLDVDALRILHERGFGKYLGVKIGASLHHEDSGFSYEVIAETQERMSAQRCAWYLLDIQPDGAEELTSIHHCKRRRLSAGMTHYKNSLGGDVIAIAYPLGTKQFFTGFLNVYRRKLYQRLITRLRPDYPIAMADDLLHVYRVQCETGTFIGLVNSTLDPISIPKMNIDLSRAERLNGSDDSVIEALGAAFYLLPK